MAAITEVTSRKLSGVKPLKPFGLGVSLLLFGVPAACMAVSLLWLWPALAAAGMPRTEAYVLCLSTVNAGLIVAALVGYRMEGNPLTWAAFSQRMRLTRMTGRTWAWTLGGTLVYGIGALLINSLAANIYRALAFSMPDISPGPTTLWMDLVILFFNIVGEELWWRGYILPRQELAFGKATWLLHGALWACFHMFKWWAVPFMLITCPVLPFVAQRTKNTWPGMVSHLAVNGVGMILSGL